MNAKYQDFWGLTQPLFISQLDDQDLHISTPWRQLTDHLLAYLETQGEVFSLIGPQGCGKSTYLKWLLRQTPPGAHQFIMRSPVQTINKSGWFLRSLVAEFPKEAFISDPTQPHKHAQRFQDQVIAMLGELLPLSNGTGGTGGITFIIDHAQAISDESMVEVETFSQAARLANLNINILLVYSAPNSESQDLPIRTARNISFPAWSLEDFTAYVQLRLQSQNIDQQPTHIQLSNIYQNMAGNISRGNFLLEDLLIESFHHQVQSFDLDATRKTDPAQVHSAQTQHEPAPSAKRPKPVPSETPQVATPSFKVDLKSEVTTTKLSVQHEKTLQNDSSARKSTAQREKSGHPVFEDTLVGAPPQPNVQGHQEHVAKKQSVPNEKAAKNQAMNTRKKEAAEQPTKEEPVNPATLSDLFDT